MNGRRTTPADAQLDTSDFDGALATAKQSGDLAAAQVDVLMGESSTGRRVRLRELLTDAVLGRVSRQSYSLRSAIRAIDAEDAPARVLDAMRRSVLGKPEAVTVLSALAASPSRATRRGFSALGSHERASLVDAATHSTVGLYPLLVIGALDEASTLLASAALQPQAPLRPTGRMVRDALNGRPPSERPEVAVPPGWSVIDVDAIAAGRADEVGPTMNEKCAWWDGVRYGERDALARPLGAHDSLAVAHACGAATGRANVDPRDPHLSEQQIAEQALAAASVGHIVGSTDRDWRSTSGSTITRWGRLEAVLWQWSELNADFVALTSPVDTGLVGLAGFLARLPALYSSPLPAWFVRRLLRASSWAPIESRHYLRALGESEAAQIGRSDPSELWVGRIAHGEGVLVVDGARVPGRVAASFEGDALIAAEIAAERTIALGASCMLEVESVRVPVDLRSVTHGSRAVLAPRPAADAS